MKICLECGDNNQDDSAKFCNKCGASLLMDLVSDNSSKKGVNNSSVDNSYEIEARNSYSLGVKFEEVVQQIMEKTGYNISRRVVLHMKLI
jgi:hypothetical protein